MRVKKATQIWALRLLVLILCLVTHTTTNRLEAQTCDFYEGAVAFNSEGGNQTANYQTRYFLIDPADSTIQYLSETPSFENVVAGYYEIYAVNYNTQFRIVGLTVNSHIEDINSLCPPDMSSGLPLRVCSRPRILSARNINIDVCLDEPLTLNGPDMEFEEPDGDGLELHITIASGGDPTADRLDVDLTDVAYALKTYSYPTLLISAASGAGNNGITPDDAETIMKTLNLVGGSSIEGTRTVTVKAVDLDRNESNTELVYFNAIDCSDCESIIGLRSDTRFQEDCNNPYDYCLEIHQDSAHRYEILDNGLTVSQLSTCSPDTVVFYSYMSLASETGPFEVSMWNVGDRSFRANFDDFDQLAMYMEAWDVIGQWANNTDARIIQGPQIRNAYGALDIIQVSTGKSWTIRPDRRIQRNSFISVPLSIGDHELVIVDKVHMCRDTIDVTIVCDDAVSYVPEFISLYDTVQVGQTDTFCLDNPGVEIVGIYNECEPSSGEFVRFGTNGSCITFEGIDVGIDSFCVVACGPIGDCDTTTLYVNVIPTITSPVAVDDSASTIKTVPVFVDIMYNDELNNGTLQDVYILDDPDFGTVSIDRMNENIAEYVPRENFCGWIDSFTYVIVNEVSQDTATVIVDIKCDSLRVLNGFSPNGDGVNDVFVILGIEDIEDNRVRTYNRWGNMVFSKENYTNQEGWDGSWQGNNLPDGTYFYTIEDRARRVVRSGWVQIYRG